MNKMFTQSLVFRAARKTLQKAAEDGGPPIGIAVMGAEGNIILAIASDVVSKVNDHYTAMIAKTALHCERHTKELDQTVLSFGACTPWFYTPKPGGVIFRTGKDGHIAGAVAVTSDREDCCYGNGKIGGNHDLAIVFADSLGDPFYAISDLDKYLEFVVSMKLSF